MRSIQVGFNQFFFTTALRNEIQNQTFCRSVPMVDLEHSGMDSNTVKCIYFWRNKDEKTGYIGKTNSARYLRDLSHLRAYKKKKASKFDQVLGADIAKEKTSWEVGTICQYDSTEMQNRLETLHVIVFNTSSQRIYGPRGFNTLAGGELNATNYLKNNATAAAEK